MSEIRRKNGTAVHDITLTNGVKVSLVEMEGAIYLEMHDPDPITFVKISFPIFVSNICLFILPNRNSISVFNLFLFSLNICAVDAKIISIFFFKKQ